jgi:hypothetical protein
MHSKVSSLSGFSGKELRTDHGIDIEESLNPGGQMATKKRAKKKQSTKKKGGKKKAAKRTLIAPKGDKRYVRRGSKGRFKESDDVGKSLASDRRKRAKRKAPRGQGDKGD